MFLIQFIILQVIVFGAVIYFLKRILYSDTQSAVNRLDLVYQDLLAKQKELTQKIEQAEKEYKEKKEEATKISEKMKREAMDGIREQEDKVFKEAKAQADDIVAKARAASDKLRREIEKDVRSKMIDYVSEILNLGLSSQLMAMVHRGMVAEFIGREKDLDFSKVSPEVNKVVIKTALPLSKEEKDQLAAIVANKLGRVLQVEEVEDKNLVAGIALFFGTLALEGSYTGAIRDAATQAKNKNELTS